MEQLAFIFFLSSFFSYEKIIEQKNTDSIRNTITANSGFIKKITANSGERS